MSLAIVYSRANIGVEALLITVEAHLSNGLPCFSIVGLPETAVKESKERVRSAILNSHLEFPDKRITVNLAPADIPKSGGRFDLAIAVSILAASKQLPEENLKTMEFLGELALSGTVRPVEGILPGVVAAGQSGRECVAPRANENEAGLVKKSVTRVCNHLLEVCAHIQRTTVLRKARPRPQNPPDLAQDLQDVAGQHQAHRALTIAAAGGHNLLMRGPPGTGKTMLASRICGILPMLDEKQALEVAAIRSISSLGFRSENWQLPPFRAPHHSASAVALVGGGSTLKTGEITLAHHGVLFLDELPEFSPRVLEALREPIESGAIMLSRAKYRVRLPAQFQLIAAMNPCPCGYAGDPQHDCRCTEERVKAYRQRVSGPLMDRIDMHVDVPRLQDRDRERLLSSGGNSGCSSAVARARVSQAHERQLRRAGKRNALLSQAELKRCCQLAGEDEDLLNQAVRRLRLSTRAFFRILKIARTIADVDASERVRKPHLLEAIAFRSLDRQG